MGKNGEIKGEGWKKERSLKGIETVAALVAATVTNSDFVSRLYYQYTFSCIRVARASCSAHHLLVLTTCHWVLSNHWTANNNSKESQ